MSSRFQSHLLLALLASLPGMAAAASAVSSAGQFSPELIEHGRQLAIAADCAGCHTRPGHPGVLAGGLAINTPLGPIYTSNITPDPNAGIGRWSLSQFSEAVRAGRSPDKGRLYPAMPYTAYSRISDQDIKALYAYLMQAVKPDSYQPPVTDLPFPFIRPAMLGWSLLHPLPKPISGDDQAAAESVARGRYLVDALAHCSTCHTPRGLTMAEDPQREMAGNVLRPWTAPNITSHPSGIADWSDAELGEYLHTGHNRRAVAAGDMGVVVAQSLSLLPQADITAMVRYLRSLPTQTTAPPLPLLTQPAMEPVDQLEPLRPEVDKLYGRHHDDGQTLYMATCASCHGPDGTGSLDHSFPDLHINDTVRSADPGNLIAVISLGIKQGADQRPLAMPAFSPQLNPDQIASLASYVRQRFAGAKAAVSAQQVHKILATRQPAKRPSTLLPWLLAIVLLLLIVGGYSYRQRRHSALAR